jgi:hypothetical protein
MGRADATGHPPSGAASIGIGIGIAVGATGLVGAVVVWLMGYDPLWAVATVLGVGAVAVAFTNLGFDEDIEWDPPRHETPPGFRRDFVAIAASLNPSALARFDRLFNIGNALASLTGRDAATRHRPARLTAEGRMRGLLIAELHDRGLDPASPSTDDAVLALLGSAAIAILRPDHSRPITTAAIESCLDAVERLATESTD